jgi:hypothetical protein
MDWSIFLASVAYLWETGEQEKVRETLLSEA